MTEHWKQFSLYPPDCRNRFQPQQVLHAFLPQFINENPSITCWHCLFEPSALVRFQAPNAEILLQGAKFLAERCGLVFELGDCSADLNPYLKFKGEDYLGEAEEYGSELWEANKQFMQAASVLALEIVKFPHRDQPRLFLKFGHLYTNALGMNFLEESTFTRVWSEQAIERYRECGRS